MSSNVQKALGRVAFGWWIVAGVVWLQLLFMGLLMQTFGVFAAVWQAEFKWSATAIATVFAVQQTTASVLAPAQGWLLTKLQPRPIIGAGVGMVVIGLAILGTVDKFVSFAITFGIIGIGMSLAGPLSLSTVLVKWFDRRRTLALAAMQIGKGIGGLLAPALALTIAAFGWRASVWAIAFLSLTLGSGAAALMRNPQADGSTLLGHVPTEAQSNRGASWRIDEKRMQRRGAFTVAAAMRTQTFWLIAIGQTCCAAVATGVLVHIVAYLHLTSASPVSFGALVVADITAFMMLGLIVSAVIGDPCNKAHATGYACMGHVIALTILLASDSQGSALAFGAIHGFAWGIRDPLVQAIRADYFGTSAYAILEGNSRFISALGVVGGPLIVGFAADRLGGHDGGFAALLALASVAAVAFLLVRSSPKESRHEALLRRAPGANLGTLDSIDLKI